MSASVAMIAASKLFVTEVKRLLSTLEPTAVASVAKWGMVSSAKDPLNATVEALIFRCVIGVYVVPVDYIWI